MDRSLPALEYERPETREASGSDVSAVVFVMLVCLLASAGIAAALAVLLPIVSVGVG